MARIGWLNSFPKYRQAFSDAMARIGWLNSIPRVGSSRSAITYAFVLKLVSILFLDLSPEVAHQASVLLIVMAVLVDMVSAWYRYTYASGEGNNAPMTTGRGGEQGVNGMRLTEEFAELSGPRAFSCDELIIATDTFAENRILGKGGFGIMYKGYIGDTGGARIRVAVKKMNADSPQGLKRYRSEVLALSQVMHRNLVRLIGYCHEGNEFFLVYEFVGGGSLEDNLFTAETSLTWERRHNIALALASVLDYLHKQFHQCVIHRNIRSKKIMLDEEFVAKLAGFGLARLFDRTGGQEATQVIGMLDHLAPENQNMHEPSERSDIYSFGVVLLELVCGRSVSDRELRNHGGLVRWVWKHYGSRWRKNLLSVVDRRLLKNFNKKQAEALLIVGLWCAHPIAASRPSIEEAMAVLNLRAKLPRLRSKMPSSDVYLTRKSGLRWVWR